MLRLLKRGSKLEAMSFAGWTLTIVFPGNCWPRRIECRRPPNDGLAQYELLEGCGMQQLRTEVFILTTEPPETLGGMETFIREQIRGLEQRGYIVRTFHRRNSGRDTCLRLANRVSRPLSGTLLGWDIRTAAPRA